MLTPLAIDPAHPFPFIPNLGFTIALQLTNKRDNKSFSALIPVPPQLKRFIRLPDSPAQRRALHPAGACDRALFRQDCSPAMRLSGWGMFRLLRDSDVEIEEEAEDLVLLFETLLKRRRRGSVIHMKCSASMPEALRQFIAEHLDLDDSEIVIVENLMGLSDLSKLILPERPDLVFKPYIPALPRAHPRPWRRLFRRHPRKGPHRPPSRSRASTRWCSSSARPPPIPMWWRSSRRSTAPHPTAPSSSALIEAAESGKSVTALVELKARFDEAANIKWARDLERAGVQVVYGFIALKTHAKISLVVRREGGQLATYCHFGTGNYHPNTAKIYTDLSLFSADPALGRDAAQLFNFITGYAEPVALEKLAMSPLTLRGRLIEDIQQEIMHARAGKPAAHLGQAQQPGGSRHDRRALSRQPGRREGGADRARHLLPASRACPACPTISASSPSSAASWNMAASSASATAMPCRTRTPRSTFPRPTGCRATWTAGWKPWFPSKIPPSINRSLTRSWWRS